MQCCDFICYFCVRQVLRQVWAVEKQLLLQVVPLLQSIHTQYPTDVFYFDIIPVTPPNLRPVSYLFWV